MADDTNPLADGMEREAIEDVLATICNAFAPKWVSVECIHLFMRGLQEATPAAPAHDSKGRMESPLLEQALANHRHLQVRELLNAVKSRIYDLRPDALP